MRVIRSEAAMRAGAVAAEMEIPRRRAVRVGIRARLGDPFEVRLSTEGGAVSALAKGPVVERAKTREVTSEDLVAHVGRMGGSPFEAVSFDVELDDGCGMAYSAVHKVRAEACAALEEALLAPYDSRSLPEAPRMGQSAPRQSVTEKKASSEAPLAASVEVCALVADASSAWAALEAGATRLYATVDALGTGDWPADVVPLLDEVCRERDHDRLDRWVREGESIAVGNVSELVLACERGALAEVRGCIPVHNSACLAMLEVAGARAAWLSPELSLDEVVRLAQITTMPLGLMVLGRVRAMTSEHCVLQVADRCIHDCARCSLRQMDLRLRNAAGEQFPVRTDLRGRSRVYASRVLDVTPQVPELLAAGVLRLGADCTLLSPDEVARAVRRVVRAVEAARVGRRPEPRLSGATSGHLLQPIG